MGKETMGLKNKKRKRMAPIQMAAMASISILALASLAFALVSCMASAPPQPGMNARMVAPAATGAAAPKVSMDMASTRSAPPPSPAPAGITAQADALASAKPVFNTEEYQRIVDNPFLNARDNPVSTFSIDVDTASYANVRRFLNASSGLPPKDAVRIEELVNYFSYSYSAPTGEHPVEAAFAMSPAPWNNGHWLLRVALKARDIETASLPASNLVLLLDTSGSMQDENKLPLLKESLKIMIERLRPQDKVSIVAYAGSTGLILDSTPGSKKEAIMAAFERLQAGGSTAGGAGIMMAYDVAKRNFIAGGNNRVILCTDGDFNVGVSSTGDLERMIEEKRKDNIYLTVIGLGMDNYKDSRMETLADKGNGNYAYIDNLLEGKKVLGKEIWGNLFAVAKDVKIQIEFNPAAVRKYRLIGYENRLLAREDFNDDTKDAGEMGAGQTVTAFYELVSTAAPDAGQEAGASATEPPTSDPLVFQQSTLVSSDDLLVFKLRYKKPGDGMETSRLVSTRLSAQTILKALAENDEDFRFASAVVEFGMMLRDSPYKGSSAWRSVMDRARSAKGADREGYRAEFVRLVELAELKAGK
jgi:Ca-activated chloride channel family protein